MMYLGAAIKMAVCLVEIIDDDVSQNHCVSNSSSTKTVTSSNFSQHILTRIVDGEWEVGPAEIDYPDTWYNIREGKNSVEIYVPDKWAQEFSIQPGYYEKVIDMTDELRKAGLANLTDVHHYTFIISQL